MAAPMASTKRQMRPSIKYRTPSKRKNRQRLSYWPMHKTVKNEMGHSQNRYGVHAVSACPAPRRRAMVCNSSPQQAQAATPSAFVHSINTNGLTVTSLPSRYTGRSHTAHSR